MIDKAGMAEEKTFDVLLRLRREAFRPHRVAQSDDFDQESEVNLESMEADNLLSCEEMPIQNKK